MKTSQRVPHLLLRGTTVTLAALAVTQVALAGSFLSGHYPVLRWHFVTGMVMLAVALLQAVAVLLPGRRQRPRSMLIAGLVLPVVVAVQGALGMSRVLGLHVPLGVLIVVGIFRIVAWAWGTPVPVRQKVFA
jgi:hypothetical protein